MLQVARGVEDVWAPPGGASISTAAAAEGVVVASCTHLKVSQTHLAHHIHQALTQQPSPGLCSILALLHWMHWQLMLSEVMQLQITSLAVLAAVKW